MKIANYLPLLLVLIQASSVLGSSQNIRVTAQKGLQPERKRLHLREQYATNPGGYRSVKIKTAIY